MARPTVDLFNYEAVYDFYEKHRQNRAFARFAHFLLNRVYRCDLSHDDDAPEAITEAVNAGTRLVISPNHVTADDQYVIVAFAEKLKALRPLRGRTFIPAEPSLFRRRGRKGKMLRWAVDELGAVPTFRLTDLERRGLEVTDEVRATYSDATLRASETQVTKLATGHHMAGFWEGTRNRTDHRVVQPLKKGIAHTAIAAATMGPVAILPVGLYYGCEPDDYDQPVVDRKYRPHVHIGRPFAVDTGDVVALTERVHSEIQRCVDIVVERSDRLTGRCEPAESGPAAA